MIVTIQTLYTNKTLDSLCNLRYNVPLPQLAGSGHWIFDIRTMIHNERHLFQGGKLFQGTLRSVVVNKRLTGLKCFL